MHGGKNQNTGFRADKVRVSCFQITHLAHKNDIGILPKTGSQRRCKTIRVQTHFALSNQASPVGMDKLNGILNGDYMLFPPAVDDINQGRHGRAFSGSCGACNQNKTSVEICKTDETFG